MHTLKPMDRAAILSAARDCQAIVTAEEHSVYGGLGEAVAGILAEVGRTPPLRIVGIPDEDTVTGSQADIFRHYGISTEGISAAALSALESQEATQ
jgi:transketolase